MTVDEARDVRLARGLREALHPSTLGSAVAAGTFLASRAERLRQAMLFHPEAVELFGIDVVSAASRQGDGCRFCWARLSARVLNGKAPQWTKATEVLLGQKPCPGCIRSWRGELAARAEATLADCRESLAACAASEEYVAGVRRYFAGKNAARYNEDAGRRLGISASATRDAFPGVTGDEFLASVRRRRAVKAARR